MDVDIGKRTAVMVGLRNLLGEVALFCVSKTYYTNQTGVAYSL
jgi:hypothetical protein